MQKKKIVFVDLVWFFCFVARIVFLCLIFDCISYQTIQQKIVSITMYCVLQISNFLFWIFSKYKKCNRKQKLLYIIAQISLTAYYIFLYIDRYNIDYNFIIILLAVPTISKIVLALTKK